MYFPCLWGLNNATELSDATIVYEGTELKDTIVDICSPGDIRAIAVEDFLTDYAVKDPALLVAMLNRKQYCSLLQRNGKNTSKMQCNIENYHDLKGNTLSPTTITRKDFL